MMKMYNTCAFVAGSALAAMACAQSVTMTMVNGDGGGMAFNTTAFSVTNNAGAGVRMTQMSLTVGDVLYNFDQLYLSREQFIGGNGTQTASLFAGDRVDDNVGVNMFVYMFTNFDAGVTFRGQWDVDNDNGTFDYDTRSVLFNNGAAPNAVASFLFSDGSSISYEFPDLPVQSEYTLIIPSPAAGVSVLSALAMIATRRRRA